MDGLTLLPTVGTVPALSLASNHCPDPITLLLSGFLIHAQLSLWGLAYAGQQSQSPPHKSLLSVLGGWAGLMR